MNNTKEQDDNFFTMLPRWILKRDNLSLSWKVGIAYMTTRLNLGFWLLCAADVCNETGMSKPDASRLFAALESWKAITYHRTRSVGAKRFKEFNGDIEAIKNFVENYRPSLNPQFHHETPAVSVRNL